MLTLISTHPDLVAERRSGGRLDRAFARNRKLRETIERSRRTDGDYELTREVAQAFERVFRKAAQGLFFGLYRRFVAPEEVRLVSIGDRRFIAPEQVIDDLRPSAIEDITDQPLSEIRPNSWHVREPIFIAEMAPANGGPPIKRVLRLKRETKVEWLWVQPDIFRFAFVKCGEGGGACVLDLWDTLVAVVKAPWPDDRGPLRKGRKNPLSRDGEKKVRSCA